MTDGPILKVNRWLWIFSSVGMLGVLALVVLVGLVIAFMLADRERLEPAPIIDRESSAPLMVQNVSDVAGTNLVQVTIGIGDPQSGGSYSGSRIDKRNLILLNKTSGSSRRLLRDNDRTIREIRFFAASAATEPMVAPDADTSDLAVVPATDAQGRSPPPAYYVLRVAQFKGQHEDVLVGNLQSGSQAFILTGIDGVDRMWMISPTRLALLLRKRMALHYDVIDIPSLKLVTERPVAID